MKGNIAVLFIGVLLYFLLSSETLEDPTEENILSQDMKPSIESWARAIEQFEGWAVGSRSYRNNNPGNLKGGAWDGIVSKDASGFLVFATYQDGWNALVSMLQHAAEGISHIYQPSMSFFEFFQKYAPSRDHNNPGQYAQFVANQIGVDPSQPISILV